MLRTLLLKLHHSPDMHVMASSGVKTTTKYLMLSNISSDARSHCDNKSLLPIVSMISHLKSLNISVQSMKAYYIVEQWRHCAAHCSDLVLVFHHMVALATAQCCNRTVAAIKMFCWSNMSHRGVPQSSLQKSQASSAVI